ncbi:MAG: D-alanyl-D-alanine carboxypeptidase/D-alanyl-D-alanine-endopeptidase, partial [Cytophagales bacterium]|nr:D-alanyl-D-alanine carboxypeptidase/D-alanyl-D-alanine-endopeptidase [Cytophagales bacterium]
MNDVIGLREVGLTRQKLLCLVLLLDISLLIAQPAENIKNSVQKMVRSHDFKHATLGFCLLDAKTGQVLADYNREASLLPASTLKLITTACAWDKLGGAYAFKTFIYRTGFIERDGTLKGDIIIKGGGDPSLGSARFGEKYSTEAVFAEILSSISAAGISKISGNIYADANVFEEELVPPTWIWLDMGNYFGAGASGLTINENVYSLVFKPGKRVGDSTQILRTEPETGLRFKNNVTTSPAEP